MHCYPTAPISETVSRRRVVTPAARPGRWPGSRIRLPAASASRSLGAGNLKVEGPLRAVPSPVLGRHEDAVRLARTADRRDKP